MSGAPPRSASARPRVSRRLGRKALEAVALTGVTSAAYSGYQRWLVRRTTNDDAVTAEDGLPVPSQRLIVLVAGPTSPKGFLRKGRVGAELVREVLAADGAPLEEAGDVLDFGVGCGRIARHWKDVRGPRFHGCDLNPELVAWTDRNLPFVATRVNGLEPPLSYGDASFDVIYAFSVFTHLSAELQPRWMGELRRVLRPGGRLLLSTHGAGFRNDLDPHERTAFDRGELVVRFAGVAGSNLCGAYHPESHVRTVLAHGFEVRRMIPEGARANGHQDLWLLRRRDHF